MTQCRRAAIAKERIARPMKAPRQPTAAPASVPSGTPNTIAAAIPI